MEKAIEVEQRIPLRLICPDYDEVCLEMTHNEALHCFEGFPNDLHAMKHGGCDSEGIGVASGACPILTQQN